MCAIVIDSLREDIGDDKNKRAGKGETEEKVSENISIKQ
jgi:hypothetical protein